MEFSRTVEWVAFPFSRGSSQPSDRTQVFIIAGSFFTSWTTREALLLSMELTISPCPKWELDVVSFLSLLSWWFWWPGLVPSLTQDSPWVLGVPVELDSRLLLPALRSCTAPIALVPLPLCIYLYLQFSKTTASTSLPCLCLFHSTGKSYQLGTCEQKVYVLIFVFQCVVPLRGLFLEGYNC